jgi:hypothetical protein
MKLTIELTPEDLNFVGATPPFEEICLQSSFWLTPELINKSDIITYRDGDQVKDLKRRKNA